MPAESTQVATFDPDRMFAFRQCVENYGVSDPTDPWANNCLASDLVAYTNGLIARADVSIDLRFDPKELSLCARLAAEAARKMGPSWPGIYSANDTRTAPFYVASAAFGLRQAPDSELIRAVFGGALCTEAVIVVEPLAERGDWWEQVQRCVADCQEDDEEFDTQAEVVAPWQSVIRWFAEQPELHHSSIVRIWVPRHRGVRGGCVSPWLVVGVTAAGSLAGISTCIVKG